MPSKKANVKNEDQYEALKDKGMSKQRAAKIANAEKSSKHGGQQSGKGGDSSQGGTNRTAAVNAVHLARLLRSSEYPAAG
ncbi:MAG: DUF7218 family protein [Nocardioides sp.]